MKELVKIANDLDALGEYELADKVDAVLNEVLRRQASDELDAEKEDKAVRLGEPTLPKTYSRRGLSIADIIEYKGKYFLVSTAEDSSTAYDNGRMVTIPSYHNAIFISQKDGRILSDSLLEKVTYSEKEARSYHEKVCNNFEKAYTRFLFRDK